VVEVAEVEMMRRQGRDCSPEVEARAAEEADAAAGSRVLELYFTLRPVYIWGEPRVSRAPEKLLRVGPPIGTLFCDAFARTRKSTEKISFGIIYWLC
jgi:hypothetical protein